MKGTRLANSGRTLQWLCLGLILILGTALRFYGLGGRSLWGDEINTAVLFVRRPLAYIATHFHPNNHTLFSLLARIFTMGEKSDYLLRMPAAMFGIAAIAAVYRLGRVVFGPGTGLIAALLLAVSPYHLAFSQEARGYSGVVFFSALSIVYLFQAIEKRERRYLCAFVLTTALLLYTHLFSGVILAAEVCVLGGCLLGGWLPDRHLTGAAWSQVRSWLAALLILAVLLAILYAPLWLSLLSIIDKTYAGDYAGPLSYSTDWRLDAASQLKLLLRYAGSRSGSWQAVSAISLSFFLVGLVLSVVRRLKYGFALASLLPLPFLFVAMLDVLLGGFYAYSRFFVFLLPVFLILAAYGIMSVGELVAHLGRRWLGSHLPAWGVSLVLAGGMLGSLSVSPLRQVYTAEYQGWRGAGQYLADHARLGDLVVQMWLLQGNSLGWYYDAEDHGVTVAQIGASRPLSLETWQGGDIWWILVHEGQVSRLEKSVGDEFDVKALAWLAVLHRKTGVSSQADFLDTASRLLKLQGDLSPSFGEVYDELVTTVLRTGGFELAEFYVERGNEQSEQRAWISAVTSFQRATVCWPTWGLPYTRLGNAYRAMGKVAEAEDAYRQSMQAEPGYVGAYINLADILLAQSRPEEALELYEQATDVAPDSAWAHSALGSAYLKRGDTVTGLAHLQRAVDLEPDNVTWLLALADGCRKLDQVDRAARLYQQVLILQPGNQRASEALQALSP